MTAAGDPRCSAHLSEEAQLDLDSRARIECFVRDFYRDVAQDDLLGPVFAAAHVDWPAHIATLTDFWVWQLLGERGYEGNPLRAHEPLHARRPLDTPQFERWLAIFDETVDRHWCGPVAQLAKHTADGRSDATTAAWELGARGRRARACRPSRSTARSNMRSDDV